MFFRFFPTIYRICESHSPEEGRKGLAIVFKVESAIFNVGNVAHTEFHHGRQQLSERLNLFSMLTE